MKKGIGAVLMALFGAALVLPQETHVVSVINITVPVRVFDGDRFVDSLKLEDFEIYEDGKPQTVLAAYLIRGSEVRRQEAPPKSAPPMTRRHFVMLFRMVEYLPELDSAINVFFDEVLRGGDSVDFITPRKIYRLKGAINSVEDRRRAKQEITSKVRQDVLVQSEEYDSAIRDLTANLESIADPSLGADSDLSLNLNAYATNLQRLEALQTVDVKRMTAFAGELKKLAGAKHLFIFYQKERVPQFSDRLLMRYMTGAASPEQALKIAELMAQVHREIPIDRVAIQKVFADASVDVHFLYITRTRKDVAAYAELPRSVEDIKMAEHFGDIYSAFREITAATGGTANAAANPASLLRKAVEASEQYYLLYYRPQDYKPDRKFHAITVKLRKPGYRLSHRAGYMATEELPSTVAETPAEQPAAGILPDVETVTPDLAAAPAPAESLLKSAAAYCRRLQDAALRFSCREEVRERLWSALLPKAGVVKEGAGFRAVSAERLRYWTYDYLLVRRQGRFKETRVLLEENGQPRHLENARLATERFEHSDVILGPVGLLGEEAQKIHSYRVVKEQDISGDPVIVLDVRPKEENTSSLYGKAWVRIRDGTVTKIEWSPASMGNYEKIERLARAIHAQPRITFASEYAYEKKGLRFPSAYSVEEGYLLGGRRLAVSKTEVFYKDYKFFIVETEVKF